MSKNSSKFGLLEIGRGPKAIIFVHGNSHDLGTFEHQFSSDDLKQYKLIGIDLPGHGSSYRDESGRSYSLKFLANYLVDTIHSLKLEEYIIVGHSLGGHVVMQALDRLKPKGILLFGCPPLKKPLNFEDSFLPSEALGVITKGDITDREAMIFSRSLYYNDDETLYIQTLSSVVSTDPLFRVKIGESLLSGDYLDESEILKNIECEICFLAGEYDSIVNANYIKKLSIKNLFKDTVLEIEEAGHNIHQDNTLRFNKTLSDFSLHCFQDTFEDVPFILKGKIGNESQIGR
jgi:pimeloyl-ACP methyl ester carboxylesterase